MNKIPVESKACSKCGHPKPLSEFVRRHETRQGWASNCNDCRRPAINAYRRRRYRSDPVFREAIKLRAYLRHLMLNKRACANMLPIVGVASSEDLRKHIEAQFSKGMSWGNYGRRGWQIDHIKAVDTATSHEELLSLFHFTNLRPKWWYENRVGTFIPS